MKHEANSQALLSPVAVPLYKLKAALELIKTVDKLRPYINCLRVEVKDEDALLIATNGHALLAQSEALGTNGGRGSFEIPGQILDLLPKLTEGSRNELFHLSPTTVRGPVLNFGWEPTKGHEYPNWRRVIPSDDYENSVAKFDPKYALLFNKISKILQARSCHIHPNCEPNPALVTFDRAPEAFGVIMPMKMGDFPTKKPFPIWEHEAEEVVA
ncbi:hypothetical protein [Pseudovibrio sp. Ad26]|uniref:hypothetical protein n=1 Tax=Pseudovibrio sp. Ad26 TaxID=989410 RepID=UPI0007AEC283|nr:hypothetical protein [Pseudovibrio sp. Ad26]KZK99174.1 hypothetical protein PsAD26_04983 [Pseudovibrio sp. Ad26]